MTYVLFFVTMLGMQWRQFHHPDISFPVVHRRAVDVLVNFLADFTVLAIGGGRTFLFDNLYATRTAQSSALSRLKKQGLIVYHDGSNGPGLALTAKALSERPIELSPETRWNKKWNGIWYQIIYDVPESNRSYRSVLRRFLRAMKMGKLQNSVYITPEDIRPAYYDLVAAADADIYAYLFEVKTVLGQSHAPLVDDAWDFDALGELQRHYLMVYQDNYELLKEAEFLPQELLELAQEELMAYLQSMENDPLLPRKLYPAMYRGFEVYAGQSLLKT